MCLGDVAQTCYLKSPINFRSRACAVFGVSSQKRKPLGKLVRQRANKSPRYLVKLASLSFFSYSYLEMSSQLDTEHISESGLN